jgi:hypothetical protein
VVKNLNVGLAVPVELIMGVFNESIIHHKVVDVLVLLLFLRLFAVRMVKVLTSSDVRSLVHLALVCMCVLRLLNPLTPLRSMSRVP